MRAGFRTETRPLSRRPDGYVRAFGKTGVYTDWSDSATRMCI